jgi:hypothetical protein
LTRYSSLLMIALGLFSILVNTTLAAVIIVLGLVMFVFEWMVAGKAHSAVGRGE